MRRSSLVILIGVVACARRAPPPPATAASEHWEGDWSPRPRQNAEVVATVNGASIYAADVIHQGENLHQTPARALATLIDAELLAQEARRRGLTDDPEVVDARKKVRVRVLAEQTFVPRFSSPADVPREDVERALRSPQLRGYFDHAEGRIVGWVRANVPEKSPPEVEAAARELAAGFGVLARAARPKTKEDLSSLSRLFSSKLAGDVFATGIDGPAVPEFAQAAFAIPKVGDVTDPVRTPWGWDILVLFKIVPERHATPSEAMAEVRERIFDPTRREAFLRWADALVARSQVYRNDELLGSIQIGEGAW